MGKLAAAGLIAFVAALGIGLMLIMYVVSTNNSIVRLDQQVVKEWSEVQNVYQLRADLVGNLVETVKGYAAHERGTLTEVTEARASATSIKLTPEALKDPEAVKRFEEAQSKFTGALSRLMVSVERYPDLKANIQFLRLQKSLAQIEARAANARTRFNAATQLYNNRVKTFPGNVIAGFLGYTAKPYFEGAKENAVAPKVDFTSGKK